MDRHCNIQLVMKKLIYLLLIMAAVIATTASTTTTVEPVTNYQEAITTAPQIMDGDMFLATEVPVPTYHLVCDRCGWVGHCVPFLPSCPHCGNGVVGSRCDGNTWAPVIIEI